MSSSLGLIQLPSLPDFRRSKSVTIDSSEEREKNERLIGIKVERAFFLFSRIFGEPTNKNEIYSVMLFVISHKR